MANPVYLDGAGNPISTIPCGTPATFNVPGFSQVWLEQKRNGLSTYDGPYAVPSPAYSAACDRDVGSYVNNVYEVSGGVRGAFIGSVGAVVTLGTTFSNNPPAGGSGCVSCYTSTPAAGNYAPGGGSTPGSWGSGGAVGGRPTTSTTTTTTSTAAAAAGSSTSIPWGLVLLVLLVIAMLRR